MIIILTICLRELDRKPRSEYLGSHYPEEKGDLKVKLAFMSFFPNDNSWIPEKAAEIPRSQADIVKAS